MAKRLSMPALVIAGCLLLAATVGWGQTTTGNVRGIVKDPDGAPLPGVTVTVLGDRGSVRSTITRQDGSYLLSAIPPGLYSVEAEIEGLAPQSVEGLRVTIAGTATVNFVLGGERVTEHLTVTSEAPLLDLNTSKVSTNYQAEFLEDLPTRRQFWDMVSVSPGMSGGSEWTNSQSAFGSSITSNSWSVDGLDMASPETGRPWWWINPETIEEVQVLGVGASAEFGNMTGAAVNVVTKSGGNQYRGNFNGYFQFDALTDTNVELEDSEFPSYVRDRFHNLTLSGGGPIQRDRAWFFAAVETYRDGETLPGADPAFPADYDYDRYDLKVDISPSDRIRLDAKYHYEDYSLGESSSAYVAPSARGVEFGTNPAWGVGLSYVISDQTLFEAHYAGWTGEDFWHSQTGSTEPTYADYSPPGGGPTLWWGGLPFPFDYEPSIHQADAKLTHYADDLLKGDHDFRFGIGYSFGSADTITKASSGGPYYYHDTYVYYYYGIPYLYDYYYRYTFTPFHYGAEQDSWSLFADDSWKLTDRLTLNLGVRLDRHNGWIPSYERLDEDANGTGEFLPRADNVIDWSLVSPRLGFAWVATGDLRTVVRGSFGIYHDGNVSGNWNYPPPGVPPIQCFYGDSWETSGENFYWEWSFPTDLAVDPALDAPRAEQYSLGVERQLGESMGIGAMVIYKNTENLIGWEILDDGVYEPLSYTDPFTGREYSLLNICDDGCVAPTIRKGNRPGAGSLAPNEEYRQDYRAFAVTFEKRYSKGWSLMGSYTLSRSDGLLPRPTSQSQGSPFYGSLSGSDPNEWLNAEQLLQNDRRHMLRLQGNFDLPWKMLATAALNWQTGRPYARLARVRFDQGRKNIIMDPATADRRLPTSTMLDVGIGKRFALGSRVVLKTDLQVLNLLNDDAVTYWETLVLAPGDRYVPGSWLWPRRAVIRLGLEF